MSTLTTITHVVALGIQAGVPAFLRGEPGTGKTRSVESVARALGAHLETVIVMLRDPQDFGGFPVLVEQEVVFRPLGWARRANAVAEHGQLAVVFLDELPMAPPAVQAPCLRMLQDRWVGDTPLHPLVRFVAAGNDAAAAGNYDFLAPLANRMVHVEFPVDVDANLRGRLHGWPDPSVPILPPTWRAGVDAWRAMTIAYLRAQPQHAHRRPANPAEAGRAWPSFRTWELAEIMLAACDAADATDDAKVMAVGGCVGHGVALEFFAWWRDLDLPDIEEVLARPDAVKLPQRADQQFALLTALVSAVIRRPTEERHCAAWQVLARAAGNGAPDTAYPAALSLTRVMLEHKYAVPLAEVRPFVKPLQQAGLLSAHVAAGGAA